MDRLDSLERCIANTYKVAQNLASPRNAAVDANQLLTSAIPLGLSGLVDTRENALAKFSYQHFRGAAYAAISVIARRVGGQQIIVARVGKPTRKSRSLETHIRKGLIRRDHVHPFLKRYTPDEVDILVDHPIYDVIDDPNDFMLPTNLWMVTVCNLLVTGRSLWVIDPNPERRMAVPIPTSWATPVHEPELYSKWLIKPPNSTAKPIPVPGEFVMNAFIPDPEDPFGCISMLQMQIDAILTGEAIATAQRVSFKNQVNPQQAIIVGEAVTGDGKRQIKLEPAQRKQLITWLRQEYSGAQKFGLPIILDAIIKDIKNLSTKPGEIGFLESSDSIIKQIFFGLGVPMSSAGATDGTNYASAAVNDHVLVTNSVNPICKLLSEAMTAWVVPLFSKDENVRAWIVPAEAYDPDLEIRRWTAARQSFSTLRNDVRTELLHIPPIEGWDDVVVPSGMMSVKSGEPVIPVSNNNPRPTNGLPAPDAADNENMRQERKAFVKSVKEIWLKAHGELESPFSEVLKRYLAGQAQSAIIALRSLPDDTPPNTDLLAEMLLPKRDWDAKLREAVGPQLAKLVSKGASLQLTTAERGYNPRVKVLIQVRPEINARIQQEIDNTLSELVDSGLWAGVNDETRRQLSFALQEGLLEGETLKDLASRIEKEMGDEWAGMRAMRIARTETGAAMNAGHYLVQKELEEEGIAFGQEWVAIIDNTTRPDHIAADGQKVGPGEMFDVGGYPAPYPGWHGLPAEHRVHCRCLAIAITEPLEASFGGRLKGYKLNGHAQNGHALAGCC
jgi:phage portal protein BeeE